MHRWGFGGVKRLGLAGFSHRPDPAKDDTINFRATTEMNKRAQSFSATAVAPASEAGTCVKLVENGHLSEKSSRRRVSLCLERPVVLAGPVVLWLALDQPEGIVGIAQERTSHNDGVHG